MHLRKKLNSSEDSEEKKKTNWEYYNPPENSSPVQYCLDSSLHGLQYISQQNRHCLERAFWLIAFILSVFCAGMLIRGLYQTYKNSPIVTVFDPEETDLWKIAFPSVTICNVNKIKLSKRKEFIRNAELSKTLSNKTSYMQSLAAIEDLKNICDLETFAKRLVRNTTTPWTTWYDKFTEDLDNQKDDYEKFINPSKILVDGSQKCKEMLVFCIWNDEIRTCSDLFRPIVTDYGYCCIFNAIPPTLLMKYYNDSRDDHAEVKAWADSEITSDSLIKTEKGDPEKYPNHQKYPSRSLGLSVMLEPNLTEYSCSSTDSEGFVIGLNSPLDFPRMRDDGVLVKTWAETFVKIHPQITVSDKPIKKFPVNRRKCYFEGEQTLPHYTKYTETNCLSECISELAQKECQCVRYYMPRSPDIPLCKPDQYNCIKQVEEKRTTKSGQDCSYCYRTCTDIEYNTEVTALRVRKHYIDKLFKAYPNRTRTNDTAIVHFYFGQDSYQTRLRKEMYTVIDLISSAGGLLGLCMGFSMLSLLEIMYYCTIRLCFIYRRKWIEKVDPKLETDRAPFWKEALQNQQITQWSQSQEIKKDCEGVFKIVKHPSAWISKP